MRKILVGLLLLTGACTARAAAAGCAFQPSAAIGTLNFGTYDSLNILPVGPVTGSLPFNFKCNGSLGPFSINIDYGAHAVAGTPPSRQMKGSAHSDLLGYNLYLDSNHTQVWGDGTSGSFHYTTVPANNTATAVTIYGSIPASQDISADSYSDSPALTINF